MEKSVFICYRREGAGDAAGRIRDWLCKEFGDENVFQDIDGIQPGQDYQERIDAVIPGCTAVLVLITEGWARKEINGIPRLQQGNDFVRREIAAALRGRPATCVIPILLENATMPDPDELPEDIRQLAQLHALQIRNCDFKTHMEKLIQVLSGVGNADVTELPGVWPCPHCGEENTWSGTGTFVCPDCGNDVVVECQCPECGQDVEIEEWGVFPCPNGECGCEFDTWECAGVEEAPETGVWPCPHCGEENTWSGTGTFVCPDCENEVVVECRCPECGQDVEIEEWGVYACPNGECGCEFDTWECAGVDEAPPDNEPGGWPCPHCGEENTWPGTGTFVCPDCENDVEIECCCPECGEDVEIKKWDIYLCPNPDCEQEFDAWECAGVEEA